jgi:S-adenosylmethionine:tRNA ribosyltransferase-isomerase
MRCISPPHGNANRGFSGRNLAALFHPSDYMFDLAPELIAQEPAHHRGTSRLLDARDALHDGHFADVVTLLPPDAVLVVNDTQVINARVFGTKQSGGAVELLFLEPVADIEAPPATTAWRCLARAGGAMRAGHVIHVNNVELPLLRDRDADGTVVVAAPGDGFDFLSLVGRLPLPPYIVRDKLTPQSADDIERYQTMFAKAPGAVAAPTAGLHMTPAIRDALTARGVAIATVTLHVGWGTFAPIRSDDIRHHAMHRERYTIPQDTADLIASKRPVVALGTTTLRALESAATAHRQVATGDGSTDVFIYPGSGHEFRIVDFLLTNFHLPESTLLMLVSAFAGIECVAAAYRHAMAQRYRFFSYGDAMLLRRARHAPPQHVTFAASVNS